MRDTPLKLLVAVDGSPNALGAVRLAAELGRRGARLEVVLLNVQKPLMSGEVGPIAPADLAVERRHLSAADVLDETARLLAEAGLACRRVEEMDEPAAAIAARAVRHGCDAIALGSRGRGRVRSTLLGSVSMNVIRRAERPVIVVGDSEVGLPPGPLRILAAADGSPGATRALAFAIRLGEALPSSQVEVLNVEPPGRTGAKAVQDTAAILADAAAAAQGSGCAVTTRAVQDSAPAEAIVRAAQASRCGMIAMGTRGRNPLVQLLLGSVAQGVLQRAPVPVIVER
ncbi:MAG: universal stress protein [Burkholderiales bacterium]|nr:universal stress protein [Burkholderiales bacterium]